MASFGRKSLEIFETLDPRLRQVLSLAIKTMNFSILSGQRGKAEQNGLFRSGLSKKEFPNSRHNTSPLSEAVDIAPYPIDWNDEEAFYFLAGIMKACAHMCKVGIRWGGDWDSDYDFHDQTFMDLGHFELEG